VEKSGDKMISSYDNFNGDEFEIDAEAKKIAFEYEKEHEDDWKYLDERLGYEHD
jgi:hypothetical protein